MSPAPPELVQAGSQFVIATHSPILMAYPDATIYELSSQGIGPADFEETEHFQVTRGFLAGIERKPRGLTATTPFTPSAQP